MPSMPSAYSSRTQNASLSIDGHVRVRSWVPFLVRGKYCLLATQSNPPPSRALNRTTEQQHNPLQPYPPRVRGCGRRAREGVIFPACRKNAITRGTTKEAVLCEMDMRPPPPSLPLSIASVAYVCVLRRSGRRTQCVTVKQANEACAAAAATRRTTRINNQRIHANILA